MSVYSNLINYSSDGTTERSTVVDLNDSTLLEVGKKYGMILVAEAGLLPQISTNLTNAKNDMITQITSMGGVVTRAEVYPETGKVVLEWDQKYTPSSPTALPLVAAALAFFASPAGAVTIAIAVAAVAGILGYFFGSMMTERQYEVTTTVTEYPDGTVVTTTSSEHATSSITDVVLDHPVLIGGSLVVIAGVLFLKFTPMGKNIMGVGRGTYAAARTAGSAYNNAKSAYYSSRGADAYL